MSPRPVLPGPADVSRSVASATLRPVALAALLVLAGCVGASVSPPDADRSTKTTPSGTPATAATPAGTAQTTAARGTPTATNATAGTATTPDGDATRPRGNATTAERNATLPPGVNASGVADAEALVAAHRAALNDTRFAVRLRANVSVGPAIQWTRLRGRVEPGLAPLLVRSTSVQRVDGDASRTGTDLWANDSAVVVRYRGPDRTELRRYDRTGGDVGAYDETWAHLPRADLASQVTQSWLVELALAVGDYRLVDTEHRDGRWVAVLRATEPVAAANFTDLNATVVVDESGLVHRASLTATAEGDDETRVHYAFAVTDLGTTSVARPAWVEAATPPNRTTERATTATADTGTPTTAVTAENGTTTTGR